MDMDVSINISSGMSVSRIPNPCIASSTSTHIHTNRSANMHRGLHAVLTTLLYTYTCVYILAEMNIQIDGYMRNMQIPKQTQKRNSSRNRRIGISLHIMKLTANADRCGTMNM